MRETVTVAWTNRRGAGCVHYFNSGRGNSAADVERLLMTRFKAREETAVYIGDDRSERWGGVERLDRWTWWLDAQAVNDALDG